MHKNLIQIYATEKDRAIIKMNEIIMKNKEEIILFRDGLVETNMNVYRAQKYSDNLQGNRYQFVYVDFKLKESDRPYIFMKIRPPANIAPEEWYRWQWRDHVAYF